MDVPWQEVVDPVDLVVRDAGDGVGVGERCLGIDAVEYGGVNQGVAMAADLPPVCDPPTGWFLRPGATARIARSAFAIGLELTRLQWFTVRRDRKPKAAPSGSCPSLGPTFPPGHRRQRSPDPRAHAARPVGDASIACRAMDGAGRAVDLPTQPASVERSKSSPSRSEIWRRSGFDDTAASGWHIC